MNILILGKSSREHSLATSLIQDPEVKEIYCHPGNYGISKLCTLVDDFSTFSTTELEQFIRSKEIKLCIIVDETYGTETLIRALKTLKCRVFGTDLTSLKIESQRWEIRQLLTEAGYQIPKSSVATNLDEVYKLLDQFGPIWVVKRSTVSKARGVLVSTSKDEVVHFCGLAIRNREKIIFETFIKGEEFTHTFLVSNGTIQLGWTTWDYKRRFLLDRGELTGGMGAVVIHRSISHEQQNLASKLVKDLNFYNGFIGINNIRNEFGTFTIEINTHLGIPESDALVLTAGGLISDLILRGWSKKPIHRQIGLAVSITSKEYPNSTTSKVLPDHVVSNLTFIGDIREVPNIGYVGSGRYGSICVPCQAIPEGISQTNVRIVSDEVEMRKDIGFYIPKTFGFIT